VLGVAKNKGLKSPVKAQRETLRKRTAAGERTTCKELTREKTAEIKAFFAGAKRMEGNPEVVTNCIIVSQGKGTRNKD